MKIEIEIDDVDILETYSRTDGYRELGRMSWLYPGDVIAQIGGESAGRIKAKIEEAAKTWKKLSENRERVYNPLPK